MKVDVRRTLREASRKELLSWALYDFAASSFNTLILTYIFATYFVGSVASDKNQGVALWGMTIGLSGFAVAVCGPLLGALADKSGNERKWLFLFSLLVVTATALLWFIKPFSTSTLPALILVGIGAASSDIAFIFYNALLPGLVAPDRIGRMSGWGWAMGYAGGMISLFLCLAFFIYPASKEANAESIRATFLFSALWIAMFSLPLFIFLPSSNKKARVPIQQLMRGAYVELWNTFLEVRQLKNIFKFLLARMLFMDGLITLFAFGGVYAAAEFNFSEQEILLFGIGLNITAGLGAASFAFLDDRFGARLVILWSLFGTVLSTLFALLAANVIHFWILALSLGVFVGPVQSSSRSYLARLAPASTRNKLFGFFALSSKATSFLGPLCVSWLTFQTGSFRIGMSPIVAFLILGFCGSLALEKDTFKLGS